MNARVDLDRPKLQIVEVAIQKVYEQMLVKQVFCWSDVIEIWKNFYYLSLKVGVSSWIQKIFLWLRESKWTKTTKKN